MTQIVGIICQDGIVPASESQTTDGYLQKQTDTQKIFKVGFADGQSGLIAISVTHNLSLETIEVIERTAPNKPLNDRRALADMACESYAILKTAMKRQFGGSAKERATLFSENSFYLTLASYHNGKPYIYNFSSTLQSATALGGKSFVAVGNSNATAQYILNKFDFPKMDVIYAVLTAIYVINEVCKIDAACSGAIQVGIVRPGKDGNGSESSFYRPEWVKAAVTELDTQESKTAKMWEGNLTHILLTTSLAMGELEVKQFGTKTE